MVLCLLIMMLIAVVKQHAERMDDLHEASSTLFSSRQKNKTKFTNFSVEEILRSNFREKVSRKSHSWSTLKPTGKSELKHANLNNIPRADKRPENVSDVTASPSQEELRNNFHTGLNACDFEFQKRSVCSSNDKTTSPKETQSCNTDRKDTRFSKEWPAWVFCTRYSDRPSAGPRSKKCTKKNRQSAEKRPRTSFSNQQIQKLKDVFKENPYITEDNRHCLARELCLSELQIKIWFQNKRAKLKKSTGVPNVLALRLMSEGLYNHTSTKTQITDTNTTLIDYS